MKNLLLISLMLFMFGCSTTTPVKQPEPQVITKIERVPVKIPDELFKKPEKPHKMNPENGTQKDVSRWLTEWFDYLSALEIQFDKVKEYNDKTADEIESTNEKGDQ